MINKILNYIKNNWKKILIKISVLLNIILIFSIIRISINVSMVQNQKQFTTTSVYNVNNNQNMNLNMFYNRYTGNKKLIYTYIKFDGLDTYNRLDSFQIMFSKYVNGFILYPVLKSKTNIVKVSYTNTYTNFSILSKTNKTIFNLFQ